MRFTTRLFVAALLMSCMRSGVSEAALTDGLQLYSSFDSTSIGGGIPSNNSRIYDLAGPVYQPGNLATPLNDVVLGTGIVGNAVILTGIGGANADFVNYGDILDVGSGEYSVSVWFKPTAASLTSGLFIATHGGNGLSETGWRLSTQSNGTLRIIIGDQGDGGANVRLTSSASSPLVQDQWYHLALTLDQDESGHGVATAYLNGDNSLFTRTNGTAGDGLIPAGYNINPAANLYVGRRPSNSDPFSGGIDEFGIWNRALTSDEVNTIYSNGLLGIGLPTVSTTFDWVSTASSSWGTAANWSLNSVPPAFSNIVFSDPSSMISTIDLDGAARTAGGLSFNGNQSSVSITGLTSTNTLTIETQTLSTTAVDLSVAPGMNVSINGTGYRNTNGTEGDFRLAGHSASNFYVMEVGAGSTLNMNATMSQTSASTTTRATRIVKQGEGTLVMNQPQNLDLRPSGTHHGGYVIEEGTLQYAVDGARGNAAASVTINDGATLEFNHAGFWAAVSTPGVYDAASGNRSLLTLNGEGVDGKGAIYNLAGNNTLASGGNTNPSFGLNVTAGLMFIASDSSIGVNEDSTLTLSHGISAHLGLGTDGNYITGTPGALTKTGEGTLIFNANNNSARNGYAEEITVAEGTFLVTSPTTETVGITAVRTTNTTQITLDNVSVASNLYVGQPITITSSGSGTTAVENAVIAGLASGSTMLRFSEPMTGGNTTDPVTITFGKVESALNTSPVTVNSGATFGGTGSVKDSTITLDGGTLAPGAPGDEIDDFVVGAANLSGTLSIEYGNGEIDKLVVVGDLDVTGATFSFLELGELSDGSYEFLSYGNWVGGDVESIIFQGLDPGSMSVEHDEANNLFLLVVESGLTGDYNGDGIVNLADYTIWRDTLGSTGPGLAADGNGDEEVNGLDYDVWKSHFGESSQTLSEVSSNRVPEPSTMLIAGMGLLVAMAARSSAWQRRAGA